eukprot:581453-Prorocentrum_minimum.AAC.1
MAASLASVCGGLVMASSRPSSSRYTSSSAVALACGSPHRRQECSLFTHSARRITTPKLQRPQLRRTQRILAVDSARSGFEATEKDNQDN